MSVDEAELALTGEMPCGGLSGRSQVDFFFPEERLCALRTVMGGIPPCGFFFL